MVNLTLYMLASRRTHFSCVSHYIPKSKANLMIQEPG